MAFLTGKLKVAGDMGWRSSSGRSSGSRSSRARRERPIRRRPASWRSVECVVLTGAGISVESGIPSFRGSQGMWPSSTRWSTPLSTLHEIPRKVWEMLTEMVSVCGGACQRGAQRSAALEEMGIARASSPERGRPAPGGRFPRVIEYTGTSKS